MRQEIISKLLDLNASFYEDQAASFSSTRNTIQPGVRKLLPELLTCGSILDLGCGNGTLSCALAQADYQGFYLGADHSESLLAAASSRIAEYHNFSGKFLKLDLGASDWEGLPAGQTYACVISFATLHHLPGQLLQQAFLNKAAALIKPGGKLILSNWQIRRSERLKAHIHPWSELGIDEIDIGPGDLLVDWRAGSGKTPAFRYVHEFTGAELDKLAKAAGLTPLRSFYSDGREGDLALYQIWSKA